MPERTSSSAGPHAIRSAGVGSRGRERGPIRSASAETSLCVPAIEQSRHAARSPTGAALQKAFEVVVSIGACMVAAGPGSVGSVERIDAEDDSHAEIAYGTGEDDGFILPHLRHRAALCALYRFWLEKKLQRGRGLPARSAIRPEELKPWLGWINLVAIVDGGRDYVFRLYGSNIAREFGRDLTGKSLRELPAAHLGIITTPLERVVRDRVPCSTCHLVEYEGRSFVWERLILPLAEDGETVDILLVGLYRASLTDKPGAATA